MTWQPTDPWHYCVSMHVSIKLGSLAIHRGPMAALSSHSVFAVSPGRPSLKRRRLDRLWSTPSRLVVCRQSNQDDEAPSTAPNKLATIIRQAFALRWAVLIEIILASNK